MPKRHDPMSSPLQCRNLKCHSPRFWTASTAVAIFQDVLAAVADDSKDYSVHDAGGDIGYEVYGSGGLLGRLQPWWCLRCFTSQPSWKVWCDAKGHGRNCSKLVAEGSKDSADMIHLLAQWLVKGPTMSAADHFACRPR